MSLSPSFNALYRQSAYAPYELNSHGSNRQNRQEVFTVASVAFAMKHDEQFRRTFLHRVCDVTESNLDLEFNVELQPEYHADLRITCHSVQAVFIVEFKLGAELRDKQNPSKPEFFNHPKGYGAIMRNHADYKQLAQLTYVVLQKDADFSDAELDGGRFRIRARRWGDLVLPHSEESPLICDLLDTLGGWGMSSLKFRKQTGMKKASRTQDAADMFQIVSAVAEAFGMNSKKFDWDVQSDSGNGAHFGLNIPAESKGFTHLSELAGSTEASSVGLDMALEATKSRF